MIQLLLKLWPCCTRCKKGFIAYHKFSGTIAMKKHVESNHFSLLKKLLKDVANLASRCPLDCEPNKKNAHVSPTIVYSFFSTATSFKKDDVTQVGFLEDLMLLVIEGLMLMKTLVHLALEVVSTTCVPTQKNFC